IDVEVEGASFDKNIEIARTLREKIRRVPGAVDVRIPQVLQHPALALTIDRERAAQVGVTQRDVANNMLVSLSSSSPLSPSFWLWPEKGVTYFVVAHTPLSKAQSVDDILSTPVTPSGRPGADAPTPFAGAPPVAPTLGSVASLAPGSTKAMIAHD